MASDIMIKFANIEKSMVKAAIGAIDDATEKALKEIDQWTPEKTGDLLSNNVREAAYYDGTRVVGKVSNDTPYGFFVEYGLGRPFKYRKDKYSRKVFRVGIGARMFARTRDKMRKPFASDFRKRVLNSVIWNR